MTHVQATPALEQIAEYHRLYYAAQVADMIVVMAAFA
jgi:hypothetical protein